jgi:NADPH:quinone reductase-like Zn-dependent oxidoreductase
VDAAVLWDLGVPVLGQFQDPEPAPEHVVVEVLSAGGNPVDLATCAAPYRVGGGLPSSRAVR